MSDKQAGLRRSMTIAAAIMAASNVLSRILGLVRLRVMATYAGTESMMDAYVFSFFIPDILNHILAGSALSITFIPIFQKLLAEKDETDAWRFFSNLMTIGTAFFLLFIGAGALFTDRLLPLFAGPNITNDPQKLALTIRLTRIILPAQLFFFWGALLNGVQYARKRFFFPALAPLFYNVGIIVGGIALFPYIKIEGFSWGVLAGAFAANVCIQIPGALRAGMRYIPVFNFRDRRLHKYAIMTFPLVLGLGMSFSHESLYRFFGSYIPQGDGGLASLDYALKIMMSLMSVFGQALAAGFYPFLTQLVVDKKLDEAARLLNVILVRAGSLLIPSAAILASLSLPVVAVLLQDGEFGAASTIRTAPVLSAYLLGAFFFAGVLIINRAYYALGRTALPLVLMTSVIIVMLPVFWFFTRLWGAPGVALASSVTMMFQFVLVYSVWASRYGRQWVNASIPPLLITMLLSTAGAALSRAIYHFAHQYITISSVLPRNLTLCVVSGIPPMILVLLVLEKMEIAEMRKLVMQFMKKKRDAKR